MPKKRKRKPSHSIKVKHMQCGTDQEFLETEDGRLKCPACGWESKQKLPAGMQGFFKKSES